MDTHLHHDFHVESHLKSSQALSDVVIGMSDGLTVPFALAAGLSGAVDTSSIILIAGIAEIAAGSIAMGLGGYLAGKTEQEHYQSERKREYYEIEHLRQREIEETKEFFAHLGLSEELQNRATEEISQNPDRWVDFMMKYELDLEAPDPRRATKSALNIGLAYIAGGIIPLSPYFFIDDSITALKYSVVATLICLFVFGYVKSKITGVNPWLGALKVMSIGALAAAAAFGIAKLFEG
ncbi:MAG: VIT1/CCC1 transporter family protein [Saprospiraceae bacterium]|jgi:VIT1/CCC1 family predicted Fe2+/Mn2+ transporter|nr:VIT1/CCC1 transporter family protein [Saprospiraceae bacterium]MBK6479765.1 VIT1/CCC1 transporter family protein [Saprospiraceae bacterium]MBK6815361.1 VIT1/CCC1 transporter family protein [Saprospiraceae bacterium]MBK7372401.1 VIT1/CCC1 transporter family protein [Saprospiraceae bacterium]MBK7439030.1 VIT1/CCC1 transporter family protein [Saprospiraceae bacterium]